MKKIALTLSIILISLGSASAQGSFNHLSLGLEVNTIGAGLELAMPIVDNHLVIKAGYNHIKLSNIATTSIETDVINQNIKEVNDLALKYELTNRINTRFDDAPIFAGINMGNAKILLEYYPFKKTSFHFTLGAFFSTGDALLNVDVSSDKAFVTNYNSARNEAYALINEAQSVYESIPEELTQYIPDSDIHSLSEDFLEDYTNINVDGRQFKFGIKDGRFNLPVQIQANKVKPYFGLGFGRSIPKSHFGFQFDLGAWYHGKLSFTSPNEITTTNATEYQTDLLDKIENLCFYPQLSFRLIYRIF